MAALQEALQCLTSIPRDKVPTDQSSLQSYITDLHTKARLIIDSVPEPPPPPPTKAQSQNKSAIAPSSARLGTTNETTLSHQHAWGKPIVKPSPSKDNPFGIPVYKLAGSDGRGHWFGRRSVHAGLPYGVWEERLSGEMGQTLRVNRGRVEEGLAPDWAVRGIGAERMVEEVVVRDESSGGKGEKGEGGGEGEGEGRVLGRLNVYHVSAAFPNPTTSRDFVAMIATWEGGGGVEGKGEREGRSWMMVSRPCEHPDAPPVREYVRGQYESVEMIREILVDGSGSDRDGSGSGSGSGYGPGLNGSNGERGEESNSVEWIMVTRSDPGGSIPRWMVEKGTPKSICVDAAKFIDWASQDPEATKEQERERSAVKSKSNKSAHDNDGSDDSDGSDTSEYEQEEHHGLIASIGTLLNVGLERYAPQAVLEYMPHSRQPSYNIPRDSKEAHEETPKYNPTNDEGEREAQDPTQSQISLNSEAPTEPHTPGDINLDISAAEILEKTRKDKLSSHERHLAKLAQEKRSVETQIELVRSDIESLGLRRPDDKEEAKKEKTSALASVDNPSPSPSSSTVDQPATGDQRSSMKRLGSDGRRTSSSSNIRSQAGTPTAGTPGNPEMQKIASALFRQESKLIQQLSKIERHQIKEAAKIEARNRKEAEKQDKARSRDETHSLRKEVESLKKECDKLKSERKQWLGLIKSLQEENTKLTRHVRAEDTK